VKKSFILATIIFYSFTGLCFAQDAETVVSPETERSRDSEFLAAPPERGDFWVSPGAEMALYSPSGVSVGGSLAAAYGNRFSIGIKAAWFFDINNELDALELGFLLRYYFMKSEPSTGPYLQLTGGPVLFFDREEKNSVPAHYGRISAGLTFGWRFLFGKLFFAEPYIRAGYPYIFGAGVSAGVHF
jgi:hypothetical protein